LPVQHKLTYLEQWIAERWERPQPNPLSTEHRPGAAALIEWRRRRQPSIADRLLRIAVDELQDERQRFVRDARGGVQLHDLGRPEHRDSVSRCSPLTSKVEPRVGSGGGVQVRSSCGLLHARGAAAKSTSASQISLGKEMPSNHNTMPSIRTAGCRDRRSGARRARAAARSRARRSTREPPLFEIVHPTSGGARSAGNAKLGRTSLAVGAAGTEPAHRDPLATGRHLAREAAGSHGGTLGETLALRATQGDAVLLHHRPKNLTSGVDNSAK
jgi:hypothetical protein